MSASPFLSVCILCCLACLCHVCLSLMLYRLSLSRLSLILYRLSLSRLSLMLSRLSLSRLSLMLSRLPLSRMSLMLSRLSLSRLSLMLFRHCSDSFLRMRSFYTSTRSHARDQKVTQQVLTSIRDASFGCHCYALTGQDVVGDAHAGLQRSLSQRHGSSLGEWRSAADLRIDFVVLLVSGTNRLSRVIVVVIYLQNSPVLRRRKLSGVVCYMPDVPLFPRIGRDRNNGTRLSPTMRDSTTSV